MPKKNGVAFVERGAFYQADEKQIVDSCQTKLNELFEEKKFIRWAKSVLLSGWKTALYWPCEYSFTNKFSFMEKEILFSRCIEWKFWWSFTFVRNAKSSTRPGKRYKRKCENTTKIWTAATQSSLFLICSSQTKTYCSDRNFSYYFKKISYWKKS